MTTGGAPTGEQILRLAAGDREAWSITFRFLQPALDAFFLRQGMRDPEDLTSEVFMRMSRNIHRFTQGGIEELRAWTFAIARTVRIDAIRRASVRPTTIPDASVSSRGAEQGGESLIDRAADPQSSEAVEHIADVSHINDLFDLLTPQQREVMELRVYGDMTMEQCAAVLDMSLGQVKQLHRRAVRKLADHIGP